MNSWKLGAVVLSLAVFSVGTGPGCSNNTNEPDPGKPAADAAPGKQIPTSFEDYAKQQHEESLKAKKSSRKSR